MRIPIAFMALLLATVAAQAGCAAGDVQCLRSQNRPGNLHDSAPTQNDLRPGNLHYQTEQNRITGAPKQTCNAQKTSDSTGTHYRMVCTTP